MNADNNCALLCSATNEKFFYNNETVIAVKSENCTRCIFEEYKANLQVGQCAAGACIPNDLRDYKVKFINLNSKALTDNENAICRIYEHYLKEQEKVKTPEEYKNAEYCLIALKQLTDKSLIDLNKIYSKFLRERKK